VVSDNQTRASDGWVLEANGGIRAEGSCAHMVLFFLGIIDILQVYDLSKEV
jgi:hypothetical protein